ncbi:hypothetical protein IFO70_02440 [Phormidium tenue FACHB-886]|nr:hypothetical protein [Phormidium tenue FACHB-886]
MKAIASKWLSLGLSLSFVVAWHVGWQGSAFAQTTPPADEPVEGDPAQQLDLDPALVEDSPVLQHWLEEVPDVLSEIRNDPSFRTRLRLGYANSEDTSGVSLGIEDVFLGRTGLAASADYQAAFEDDRQAYGTELRYYVLPLGDRINLAPTVGYRRIEADRFTTDGVTVGARLMFSLSRTGAADIAVAQSFVSPGSSEEVGITTLSFGYAVTQNLRLSTDFQTQNTPESKDDRIGVSLEWMP